jgi:hypothetical protein
MEHQRPTLHCGVELLAEDIRFGIDLQMDLPYHAPEGVHVNKILQKH